MKLQKRAIRTIVGVRKYVHTAPLFKELKLLKHQGNAYLLYAIIHIKIPSQYFAFFFSDFFVWNNSIHEHYTRQQNLFHLPLIFTKPLTKTVKSIWNDNQFSNILNLKISYVTYKGISKRHIIDNDIINLVWTPMFFMPLF